MQLPEWIALAFPAVLLGGLFTCRAVKLRRGRKPAPLQHRPNQGKMQEPDKAALIPIGNVAADGARSALG